MRAAKSWSKGELEPQLVDKEWKSIKKLILKCYKPNEQDYYLEQLEKLKHVKSEEYSLASFVDQRIYLTRRAYSSLSKREREREIIRDTMRSLQSEVKSHLNLMKDTEEVDTIGKFRKFGLKI